MQLEFTDEQDELRDGVRQMLARECPMSLVRAVVEKGATPDADALWKQMVELGWPALTVPEEYGGLGLGMVELAVVVEELGRVMAPVPYLATAGQFAPAVRELGGDDQRARFLGAVADGTLTGTLAIAEVGGSYDPAHMRAEAAADGDGYVLTGTKQAVVDGATVDEIVVVARVAGSDGAAGVGAFVVPRPDVSVTPVDALDATRGLATIELGGVRVGPERVLGSPGPGVAAGLVRALEEATVALAVEMVGTCQTIFDVTLEYAKQREQFGVPIGSFQAIKHKFADMLVALERARATAYFAALTIAEDDERRALGAASAKVAAGDCQRLLAKEGIQIHGGIGYTWEHDMHLYVRRVKSGAQLFGTARDHKARIADLVGL
ncbi:MAG TPA: acyl-CoA dehydrogenase family protein [Acidimicrobiia bacterium]|nr:acyl-CoA dehydrogenase family protein [Acidimicrobiia bacterium]